VQRQLGVKCYALSAPTSPFTFSAEFKIGQGDASTVPEAVELRVVLPHILQVKLAEIPVIFNPYLFISSQQYGLISDTKYSTAQFFYFHAFLEGPSFQLTLVIFFSNLFFYQRPPVAH